MKMLGTSLAVALGLLLAQAATAGDDCSGTPSRCGRCGCQASCNKYCKVVPEEKEIKKIVWVVKCEDFCASLPGIPSRECGECGRQGCQEACAECDKCGGRGCGECRQARCVKPQCGCVRTKKTLEKKEVICKIPCWKCVVVYSCGGCESGCAAEGYAPAPAEGAALTPAPAPKLQTPAPPSPPAPAPKRTN